MEEIEVLPLEFENNSRKLYLKKERLQSIKQELEDFCNSTNFNNPSFPQILLPYELKNNNAIEGYNEDLPYIINIINNPYIKHNKLEKEYQRVINLYNGYRFIFDKPDINEDNLYSLYKILSKHLLDTPDKLKDNNKYRDNMVYIHYSSDLSMPPDLGVETNNIDKCINQLFDYINTDNNMKDVDLFFKSQIIHFYFVYIHPYFDINGRTSRTLGMWYLNNNKAYPYTIFNRSIQFNKKEYYEIIREVKKHKNITPFIEFIAKGTKTELEKEYVISMLDESSNYNLSLVDKQTLQYILTNNANNTLLDITTLYNRYNPKKNVTYINQELLEPLFDYGIILKDGYTSKSIKGTDSFNYNFHINEDKLEIDHKIKRLNINKYIKKQGN